MDLIIIIVNNHSKRKKVRNYLKDCGLNDLLVLDSNGTYGMLTGDLAIRKGIDSVFDDQFDKLNMGQIIGVINHEAETTNVIIDEIYEIISVGKEKFNTGIVFSIPMNKILNVGRRI